jgi:hypothetical protein
MHRKTFLFFVTDTCALARVFGTKRQKPPKGHFSYSYTSGNTTIEITSGGQDWVVACL